MFTFHRPTPTAESSAWIPSPTGLLENLESLESLPQPTYRPIHDPFESPRLLIPIDKANPSKVIGNGYTVQLSPTISTVFVYDVRPEFAGRSCTLALHMPPPFPMPDMAPVKTRTPGGLSVSRLGNQVPDNVNAQNVGGASLLGVVTFVEPARQYNIASFPCEAGQRIGYQVDSIGGLEMNWFQMTYPALGLFMLVN